MKIFVTGGAGFIGSNLVDRLLHRNDEVVVYDNFSTGQQRFLANAASSARFRCVRGDLLDPVSLQAAMKGCERVFHLSANADVRFGLDHPSRDLEQNTIATFNVLEAMRRNGISQIVFSSTGSVYGESAVVPTPEDAPFPIQTSLYGASKVAGECLIEAYAEGFGFKAWIFRFVSILGERYTHGHIYDFYKQLRRDAARLQVLGDGTQRKSYLHVEDCIDAILVAVELANERVNIFNLGTDEYCQVSDSVKWITEELGLEPVISFTGGSRGWIGDNPFIYLDCKKIRSLGWQPKLSIREAVVRTVRYLAENEWVFEAREGSRPASLQGVSS